MIRAGSCRGIGSTCYDRQQERPRFFAGVESWERVLVNEFSLIDRYFSRPCARADVALSVGDDAAVLLPPPGERLVVSCDTSIAGRHFLADADPREVGYKVLAVNLSDLAAMGATARWVTLALSLPEIDTDWLEGFAEGFYTLAEQSSVCLVGGDTTRGDLSITVTAMGTAPPEAILRRDGARPGDLVAVTGTLGDAGMGLSIATGQLTPAGPAVDAFARTRMNRPTPRLAEGQILRGVATSAIDISDGLAADLGHLLERSGTGARVYLADLPISDALRQQFGPTEKWRDRQWALPVSAGDDYELLFTLPPAAVEPLRAHLAFQVIGTITEAPGLTLLRHDMQPLTLERAGHDHFA